MLAWMDILTNEAIHKVLFVLWIIILVPWLPFAAFSGMAFDAGPTFSAYLFVCCVWSYPAAVLIAFLFYQKVPRIVFLPCLNFAVLFIADFLERLMRQQS